MKIKELCTDTDTKNSNDIQYVEPTEKLFGIGIKDPLPEKMCLITEENWSRSFSFVRERLSSKGNSGRYRSSYLIYDPDNGYPPISDSIRDLIGTDYVPSMPESARILSYLSIILFNRMECTFDASVWEKIVDMDHDELKAYISTIPDIDRITFGMTDYCRVTGRERPNGLTYKCILKEMVNCTCIIGAILRRPEDPDSADYLHVIEDLRYMEDPACRKDLKRKKMVVTFRSRYMAVLAARMIQSSISRDENGNVKRNRKPMHSFQINASILKEKNAYAVEIALNIYVLIVISGRHPGVLPNIKYGNLIKRCGNLKKDLENKGTDVQDQKLERDFKRAHEFLTGEYWSKKGNKRSIPIYTDLKEMYIDVRLEKKYPTMLMVNGKVKKGEDVLKITHRCTDCNLTNKYCKRCNSSTNKLVANDN